MSYKPSVKKMRALAKARKIVFAKEITEDDFRDGLLRDFCEHVLKVNIDRAYISNKSYVEDFPIKWTECVQKCHERYKVDLSGLTDHSVQAVVSQL
jgi:hypothetical protein